MIRIQQFRSVRFSFLLLFIAASGNVRLHGQELSTKEHVSISVAARAYEDSVVIRWVPVNSAVWEAARRAGFQIVRVRISDAQNGVIDTLTKDGLVRPLSREQIAIRYGDKDKYVGIIDKTMYGEQIKLKNKPAANLVDSALQGKTLLDSRFLFAMFAASFSADAAKAGALRYVDKDVQAGGRYIYIVSTPAKMDHLIIDSGVVAVVNVHFPEQAPTGLRGLGMDRKMELHWDRNQVAKFDAYDIERSDDGGKSYHRLNTSPFFSPLSVGSEDRPDSMGIKMNALLSQYQIFIDSLPENYKDYYYRIKGYDGFAEQSPYTEPIIVHGIDLTPPVPAFIDSISNIAAGTFKVFWRPNKTDADLDGYILLRASDVNGDYVSASANKIDKNSQSFIDSQAILGRNNFYVLYTIDTSGNIGKAPPRMAVFVDSIPPAKPTGLEGLVDSSGVVHLKWNRNAEPDIKGYKVYFSYSAGGEFSQVTSFAVADSFYQDTLSMKIINRQVFYKIAAIDYNSNPSVFSAVATLSKPILFAPVSPVAAAIYIQGAKIITEWNGSSSEGVIGYEIFRKAVGAEWVSVANISLPPATDFVFTDSNFIFNTKYAYAVKAIDRSGLQSEPSFPVSIVYRKADILPGVKDLKVAFDPGKKGVLLSWGDSGPEGCFYIIYRSENDGPIMPMRFLDKPSDHFVDYRVKKGNTYYYAIRVKQKEKGLKSDLSDKRSILIP
jgi:hypothetical protein